MYDGQNSGEIIEDMLDNISIEMKRISTFCEKKEKKSIQIFIIDLISMTKKDIQLIPKRETHSYQIS
jgi:hypothetical protein